mmetsp:Transcript_260/g.801  ORF Transcript_260/g.801 Transcript_260/m.801 type:complete len:386 (-) Transcript_260:436-1593(-)|eukprot:CAMPEP_0117668630 /NCGR_PEP_ID=MMETSP0804-20121206/11663_1 /TAXON_ID=1074897 /ORGANISM="Tetraselmis astigmatica, Strain CCMP880" /LENGTH=385 /DNA_ID=CAMNT_0005476557 /DNA_START=409 /DNA_END=1566 /DNA_ORIENTATION=+
MVELWRYDSWAPPLLGGEDLQLLKTDADPEVPNDVDNDASGAASGSPLAGVSAPRPAAAKCGPVLIRTCSGAVIATQPVLRGPACRTAGRTSTPGSAVPLPSSLPTPVGLSRFRKKSTDPLPASEAEKASDIGCELSFSWEDTDLPLETAWLFDPNSEPPAEGLVDLKGEADCESKDPGSPVSVFYAAPTACSSESNSACASTCSKDGEVTGPACSAEDDGDSTKDVTPECSADTTMTRLQTSADPPLGPTQDTAAGPAAGLIEPISDQSLLEGKRRADKPARLVMSDGESDETTSRPSKKLRRAAAMKSARAQAAAKPSTPPVSAKAAAPVQPKKQKGRQCCVQCFTFSTPQWREGPQGARTLCNACGVRYRKQLNQAKKVKGK